ncbi:unnamed protein product [Triticum turgidum subsp. durum]|uniref:F-box domain-containing protein n=1 Tax=Triticum turgidum subsp. durum TaxID=4567 RepID=A0A9R1NV76_TRITD|nr:unnamed protein product [Triticum turgidum subsp. durum]
MDKLLAQMLGSIFLCLPDPADLGRTSVACKSFRDLIADSYFRRQHRKRHTSPLLGFVGKFGDFHRAISPHPSALAAKTVDNACDFSFSFLPRTESIIYGVVDIREGRVILATVNEVFGEDYVVCDPLHRTYVVLPKLHDAATSKRNIFLAPPMPETVADKDGQTTFRVIRMAPRGDHFDTHVFSSWTCQCEGSCWLPFVYSARDG